mmetsp:Transcript_17631/g.21405  ORF Transcript_17631/g.21405 Transcript_17631/m.21405 type:complete len:546 (+) Transcript_17631:288-1925(+)|eukprot:CAMPEP_0204825548 /NCGR_PEP_ID=MMETSP1346-20131115/3421_1 /ASSEMBLY_ACC=CAM_ASM_000771 /TAXON_ID=215587 /ORGANISM="Aplanochytrium stocchinoi, Strain GSBS06" /LENGTH=545 /DNA_ID=CAMNT_0051953215 /DNA_START=226 /DNA_END=1863 /DNA_ORIENTATION=+
MVSGQIPDKKMKSLLNLDSTSPRFEAERPKSAFSPPSNADSTSKTDSGNGGDIKKHLTHSGEVGYESLLEVVDNPKPQIENPRTSFIGQSGDRFILVMVGMPARGKSYIARRIRQYLSFFQNSPTELFNVGQYRRKTLGAQQTHDFFDHDNEEAQKLRSECAQMAMDDLKAWFAKEIPGVLSRVAIYDATNTTKERRRWIMEELSPILESRRQVIFIESICDDTTSEENKKIIDNNIIQAKLKMPDYENFNAQEAVEDFKKRIEHYREVYETIDENSEKDLTWIKLIDAGRQVTMNNIRGYLPGKIVQFLMNLNLSTHPIYLSRHGESEYNVLGKIGGDSGLSEEGEDYSKVLAKFVHTNILGLNEDGTFKDPNDKNASHARLFTSSLKRTQATAQHIAHPVCDDGWIVMRKKKWRALDEIYAGVFDGMTYEEIKEKAPHEFEQRQNSKLSYRYPRGESYLDVIQRLDPLVHEIERLRDPVLIIGHQGILRILYSYFMGYTREDAPFVSIPLNTVIKLTPIAYMCEEERIQLRKQGDNLDEPPSH